MRVIEQNADFEGDNVSKILAFKSNFNSLEFRKFVLERPEMFLKDSGDESKKN